MDTLRFSDEYGQEQQQEAKDNSQGIHDHVSVYPSVCTLFAFRLFSVATLKRGVETRISSVRLLTCSLFFLVLLTIQNLDRQLKLVRPSAVRIRSLS